MIVDMSWDREYTAASVACAQPSGCQLSTRLNGSGAQWTARTENSMDAKPSAPSLHGSHSMAITASQWPIKQPWLRGGQPSRESK
jgi:hypothetical protein